MANLIVTNTFLQNEPARAAEVNTNFTDVRTFVNSQVVHKDGTNPFTVMPILPSSVASGVTTAATAANKAYVDATTAAASAALLATGKPWNTAWGVLASAETVLTQTLNSTSYVDLTSLSATATFLMGRRYRLRGYVPANQTTASGFVADVAIVDSTDTSIVQQARQDVRTAGDEWTLAPSYDFVQSGFDATVTWKLRGRCSVGSTAWRVNAGANSPAQFIIEDMGPL